MTPLSRIALVAALLLAGCQTAPERPEPGPEPEPEAADPARPADEAPASPLTRAIEALQDGDAARAETLLEQWLELRPEHELADSLLEQIRTDPEELLGSDFIEIEVEPGDSLSALAAEYLGDAMLFHALARYNDIRRPRQLAPGMVLRVPVDGGDGETPETPSDEARAEALLAEAEQVEDPDHRLQLLRQAAELAPDSERAARALAEAEDEMVEDYHGQALRAWRDQQVEAAAGLWERVLEIRPDFRPAAVYLERAREVLRRLDGP